MQPMYSIRTRTNRGRHGGTAHTGHFPVRRPPKGKNNARLLLRPFQTNHPSHGTIEPVRRSGAPAAAPALTQKVPGL